MMNSKSLALDIRTDLSKVYDVCTEAQIVLNSNEIVVDQYGGDKYLIAWSSTPSLGYLLKSTPGFVNTSPIRHYVDILKNNDFSLMLADGSLIQIAYRVEDGEIQWHRLCYFPCPIVFSDEDIALYTVLDLFEVLSDQELHLQTQMVTYLRFDFDRTFSDAKHTHSHFTFGNSECRVPVYGPISVNTFFTFITDHFLSGRYTIDRISCTGHKLYDRTLPPRHHSPIFLESNNTFS